MNILLDKNYTAEAAVGANLFVKPGSVDGKIVQAAAAADLIIGVSENIAAAAGERCDVVHVGMADLLLGGPVTRGQELTADANGKGVVAAPAAGANNRIGAIAQVSGVAGDIIPVFVTLGLKQG